MTAADPVPRPARVAGVDVARGAALLGLVAVHTLEAFDDEGAPTMATLVAQSDSAGTAAAASLLRDQDPRCRGCMHRGL